MLLLPAALLLGATLYALFPRTQQLLVSALRALHDWILQLFTTKKGRVDERSALAVYFLSLAAAATLLCALHPAVCIVLTMPLFSGFGALPACVGVKTSLDGGSCAGNPREYEYRVAEACRPLGSAFADHVVVPLLLCAIGMPLRLGCSLGWLYAGLHAVHDRFPASQRMLFPVQRMGSGMMVFFLHLCAGLVGRNPLRIGGRGAQEKLMYILCLEGERDHAPISGDITQAIFLCCLCTGFLCFLLTIAGMLLM